VSDVVVDTSTWIEFLAGRSAPELEAALAEGAVVLPPIVVAELVSGVRPGRQRTALLAMLGDLSIHETTFEHWVRVGELRQRLGSRGQTVSTPDAHVAQCALDRDALLLSRDAVFRRIARLEPLRVRLG
jgi:tRNA(fMet)-specific endonuclease VapC